MIMLCASAALLFASCTSKDKPTSGTPAPSDTLAPVVQLSSPAQSDTVDQHVDVSVTASDNVGVTMVDFYFDSTRLATRVEPPWTSRLSCGCVAGGSQHHLWAKACDSAGNVGISDTVAVFIRAPTIHVSSPAQSDTVDQHIDVSVTASGSTGVTMVDFYLDSTRLATRVEPPWTSRLDCGCVAGGSQHHLWARAYDAAGNVGISDTVAVFIRARTIHVSSPAQSDTVDQHLDVTVTASDSVCVTMVDFYLDSTRLATRVEPPWASRLSCACVAGGSQHHLWAKVYDAAGSIAISDTVAVFIRSRPAFTALNWQGTAILYDTMAAKKDRSLLFIVMASCGWCQRLKNVTLVDPTVIQALGESFNIAQIDVYADSLVSYHDTTLTCRDMATTVYHVEYTPTMIVLNAKGAETGRIIGYYDPSEFTGILDSIRCRTSL